MNYCKDKILIVGGYGAVGSVISRELAKEFPGRIVVAGRDVSRANAFILKEELKASPTFIDINSPSSNPINFDEIQTIICCVEIPGNTSLLEKCLQEHINYIEIGTSYKNYERFFPYKKQIKKAGITIIPSVGLLPGLSNVFAYDSLRFLHSVTEVQVYLMLGLGEEHGLDAIRWMLTSFNRNFILQNQKDRTVKISFSEPHRIRLLHERKARKFYRFDFSDQHTIPLITNSKLAETRISFDSRMITNLLYWLKKIGLLNRANHLNPRLIKRIMKLFKLGRKDFALQVNVKGETNQGSASELTYLIYGMREAYATGLVAAFAAKYISLGKIPSELVPIEKALPMPDLVKFLSSKGLNFRSSGEDIFFDLTSVNGRKL